MICCSLTVAITITGALWLSHVRGFAYSWLRQVLLREYDQLMIARHWRGWTKRRDADQYENLLKTKVLPGLKSIAGYAGGYILRHDGSEESEFVVINLFDSLDAVRKFAGPDYMVPVFEPEAKKLLCRVEPVAMHYEVRSNTVQPGP